MQMRPDPVYMRTPSLRQASKQASLSPLYVRRGGEDAPPSEHAIVRRKCKYKQMLYEKRDGMGRSLGKRGRGGSGSGGGGEEKGGRWKGGGGRGERGIGANVTSKQPHLRASLYER